MTERPLRGRGRLVTTPFGAAALVHVRSAVMDAKEGDALAPVTIVVPTDRIGVGVRRGLARGGHADARGIAGVSVLTLRRLAETIAAAPLAAQGRRPVTQPVLVSALARLLDEQPGQFASIAEHPETSKALARAHDELSLLGPRAVARVATTGPVVADVVRLHHATRDLLAADYYDEVDLLKAAADLLRRGPDDHGSGVSSTAVAPVVLVLPEVPDPPQAAFVRELAAVTDVTAVVGLSGAAHDQRVVRAWADVLRLDVPAAAVDEPTGDLVIAATDADDEVRAVVRRVVARLAEGTPGYRIAVLYGSRDPYARLLAEHLSAAGVTFHGRGVRPATERILGRALRRLLSLPSLDFRRDQVLGLVTDAPLQWDGRRVPATAWERLSRRAGVVRADDWVGRLADFAADRRGLAAKERAVPGAGDDAGQWLVSQAEQADVLAAFVAWLRRRLREAEHARTWDEMCAVVAEMWDTLLGDQARRRLPEEEEQVGETIQGVLRSLAALDDIGARVSMTALRDLVELELESSLDRVGRAGVGVAVGAVRDGVGHDVDVVYVVGAAEGLLPPRTADDPLLPDAARERSDGVLPTLAERVTQAHHDLLAALASAPAGTRGDPRRVLTFPRGDLRRGGVRLPSRWLVPTLASLARLDSLVATQWERAAASPAVDVIPSATAAVLAAAVPASDQEWRARASACGAPSPPDPAIARGTAMRSARLQPRLTRFDGFVGAHPLLADATSGVLSPTSLETWFTCPHRYLVQYVLGVREVEDPEQVVSISALDKGGLMHRVLDRFVSEAVEASAAPVDGRPWTQDDADRLQALVSEELAAEERSGQVGLSSMWATAQRAVRADLEQFLAHDDARRAAKSLTPRAAELTFGRGGDPPARIDLDDGRTVLVRGSIDRVDVGPGGLVVIDYKTGASQRYSGLSRHNPTEHGRYLQLGLYALAARQALGMPHVDVHAAYWFITRAQKYRLIGYDVDDDTEAVLRAVLAVAVDGITAGLFPARPTSHSGGYACWACDPDGLGERSSDERITTLLAQPELAAYADVVVGEAAMVGSAATGEDA